MTKKIPIFVISLRDSQRRPMIEENMKRLQLDFSFFDAVDGSSSHKLFSHYNYRKRMWRKGYPMTNGELGCFASHYQLWERCVQLAEPIIVMEDHAEISDHFLVVLDNIEALTEREGFYKLNSTAASTKLISKIHSMLSVVKFTTKTTMTTGYILKPHTAMQLIQHAQEWLEPVDDYMDKEWEHKIPKYGVVPFSLKRRDISSEIGDRKRKRVGIFVKLRCEIIKIPNAVRKKLFIQKLNK